MYTHKLFARYAAPAVIFLTLALLLAPPPATRATPLAPAFFSLGGGVNNLVTALGVDGAGGHVYAAGNFRVAGGNKIERVAHWDGSSWLPMGSGLRYTAAFSIDTLQVNGQTGVVYAGGKFTEIGGTPAANIACWNGSAWASLGGGVDGAVHAIAIAPGGDVYAGGEFTQAGGVTAKGVARWNGSAWSALGDGFNGPVMALAVAPNGEIYAGGQFTAQINGTDAMGIARWDGDTWSYLNYGLNGTVLAVAMASNGDVYAGGKFTRAIEGVNANNIARWDGSAWYALGGGVNNRVRALAFDSAGNLYAGGEFTQAGEVAARFFARWNGSIWIAQGDTDGMVGELAAASDGKLYLAGAFGKAGGVTVGMIAGHIESSTGATQTALAATTAAAPTQTHTPTKTNTPTATPAWTQTATPSSSIGQSLYLPLVARGGAACLSEEQEPNNIASEANPVCSGKSIQGRHDGDTGTGDLFELQLSAGQIVAIGLETAEDTGVQLLLYRDDGSSLVMEKQDTLAPFAIDYAALAAGQYLVYIFSDPAAGNTARYTLQIAGQAAGAILSGGEALATPPVVGR